MDLTSDGWISTLFSMDLTSSRRFLTLERWVDLGWVDFDPILDGLDLGWMDFDPFLDGLDLFSSVSDLRTMG